MSELKNFIEISVHLTGFSNVELQGTGMAETYLNTILQNSNPEFVKYFFEDFTKLLASTTSEKELNRLIKRDFMPLSEYGGLAQIIITLWYTGNYNNNVVSSASYIQGLMWEAAETHPAGAKQPGYGSWANPPFKS